MSLIMPAFSYSMCVCVSKHFGSVSIGPKGLFLYLNSFSVFGFEKNGENKKPKGDQRSYKMKMREAQVEIGSSHLSRRERKRERAHAGLIDVDTHTYAF